MTFPDGNLDPPAFSEPQTFSFWLCTHTDALGRRHRHVILQSTFRGPDNTYASDLTHTSETATWSWFSPPDGRDNIWASCQGRSYHGNNQTVESPASLLHNCEGETRAGKAEGVHPVCGQNRFPLAGPAGLSRRLPAGPRGCPAGRPTPSALLVGVSPMCGLCVSLISFGLWPASVGCLGPGQAHPGVSIETADPGCEFLVLENPARCL